MGVAAKRKAQAKAEATREPDAMIFIKGGTFRMGSDKHYPEEAPAHNVTCDRLLHRSDAGHQRSVSQVRRGDRPCHLRRDFRPIRKISRALPHMLKAGSLVFTPPQGAVDLRDWSQWWNFTFGANWRRPYGPGSSIKVSTITPCPVPSPTPKLTPNGRQGIAD